MHKHVMHKHVMHIVYGIVLRAYGGELNTVTEKVHVLITLA